MPLSEGFQSIPESVGLRLAASPAYDSSSDHCFTPAEVLKSPAVRQNLRARLAEAAPANRLRIHHRRRAPPRDVRAPPHELPSGSLRIGTARLSFPPGQDSHTACLALGKRSQRRRTRWCRWCRHLRLSPVRSADLL